MSVAYLKCKMYFGDVKRHGRAPVERVACKGRQSHQQKRVRPDRQHSYSHFPSLYPFLPLPPTSSPSPSMPTCRRKRVLLIDTPPALLQALKSDPNKHVYYLAKTGEIFDSYEQASISSLFHPPKLTRSFSPHRSYAARMSFYRLKQFQCEVTGKSGLDYFQALESEQLEARTMHSRFPEQLKSAVLKAVQWRE